MKRLSATSTGRECRRPAGEHDAHWLWPTSAAMTSEKEPGNKMEAKEWDGKQKAYYVLGTMLGPWHLLSHLMRRSNASCGLHHPARTRKHFKTWDACTENDEPFSFHYNFCVNKKWQEFKDGASLGTSLRVPNIIKILLFIFLPKWLLPGGDSSCVSLILYSSGCKLMSSALQTAKCTSVNCSYLIQ